MSNSSQSSNLFYINPDSSTGYNSGPNDVEARIVHSYSSIYRDSGEWTKAYGISNYSIHVYTV